jgi:hypothetical protein
MAIKINCLGTLSFIKVLVRLKLVLRSICFVKLDAKECLSNDRNVKGILP